jgi:hypothetical protein
MPLTLEGKWDTPGGYDGHFVPTAAGDYTYHISGTVEGTEIDETFTSSPETFSSVDETTALQYPVKIDTPQDLSAAIDASAGSEADSAASQTSDDDDSDTALIVAIVGVVLGVAGIGVGGVAFMRRPS